MKLLWDGHGRSLRDDGLKEPSCGTLSVQAQAATKCCAINVKRVTEGFIGASSVNCNNAHGKKSSHLATIFSSHACMVFF